METDKIHHIFIGTMFYLLMLMFFDNITAITTTVILAFLKELNDGLKVVKFLLSKSKTTFDLYDLIAGIILPLFIASIINML